MERKMTLDLAMATWNARCGVADSQLYMGHWTPEFWQERMKVYKAELVENLKLAFPTA
jgi:hypothetical protein